jgi:nucleotide-binding universal stress UspA family protein
MFKHILVATDGSDHSRSAARYAVSIGQRYHAALKAIHVIDIKLLEGPFLRDISASMGIDPAANYQQNIASILEKRGEAGLAVVSQMCAEPGLACETQLVTGTVVRSICDEARSADLLAIGQHGEHAAWADGLLGSTVDSVVRRAEVPVLVAGMEYEEFSHVLAAYDGSDAALKALKVAATLCTEWPLPATVVTGANDDAASERLLDEARRYLDAYRLDARFEVVGGEPAEAIIECAAKVDANLIVMGAEAHTRVRQLILGSTTSHVIHHSPVPVLLSR